MKSSNYVRLVVCSLAALALSAGSAFADEMTDIGGDIFQGTRYSQYTPSNTFIDGTPYIPWLRVPNTSTSPKPAVVRSVTLKSMPGTGQYKVVKGKVTPQAAKVIKTVVEMSSLQLNTNNTFNFLGATGQWNAKGSYVFFGVRSANGNTVVVLSPTSTVGVARLEVLMVDASGSNALLVTVNTKLVAVN